MPIIPFTRSLVNGNVTNMNGASGFSFTSSESWASYGWSESTALIIYMLCCKFYSDIQKKKCSYWGSYCSSTFSSLGDIAAIVFDGNENRMYFHHEGPASLEDLLKRWVIRQLPE